MSAFVTPVLTGPAHVAASWLDWTSEAFVSTPNRLRHSHVVWQRAVALRRGELSRLDPALADTLELAALLHDIGRAIDPDDTEPHGFVGARLLDAMGLHHVAPLVAHHSGARQEAVDRGMSHLDVWRDGDRDLQAVLTFLDRTTSPDGERVTLSHRRADLSHRYGAGSLQVQRFDSTLVEVRQARRLLRPTNVPRSTSC
jgi:putative nucleotidyltransferase with HDIG domain